MTDTNEIPTKRCSRCGESKPLEAFNKSSKHKDGRQGYCRDCVAAYSKEYWQCGRKPAATLRIVQQGRA